MPRNIRCFGLIQLLIPFSVFLGVWADVSPVFGQSIDPAYAVRTLAGWPERTSGFADGPIAEATFLRPQSIATDRDGNMYVSSISGIRKISTNGNVTTFAGNVSVSGSKDGVGQDARFSSTLTLALGPTGDLFVADVGNRTIRRVTPQGVVTTIAGKVREFGNIDGVGENARFGDIWDLAVDSHGNVFFTDRSWGCIRKIAPDGTVTRFVGTPGNPEGTDGIGLAAGFGIPFGITIDRSDNLYVGDSDGSHGVIRKITPAGVVTTLAGTFHTSNPYAFADGKGSAAQFSVPHGLVADDEGNIYVADYGNNVIRKVTPDGTTTTLAGSPYAGGEGSTDGIGQAARFFRLSDVTMHSSGSIFIADKDNDVIRKMTANGIVTTFAGIRPSGSLADGIGSDARFHTPCYLVFDSSGNLYVSDAYNSVVRKVSTSGAVTTLAVVNNDLAWPLGLAFDRQGNLYVASSYDCTVRKITPTGVMSKVADLKVEPIGLAIDSSGNIFVSQIRSIVKIAPDGTQSVFAGGTSGHADGQGETAQFRLVEGLAVDREDNLYAADCYSHAIRKISPTGVVTTVAGHLGSRGEADGPKGTARLERPTSVAVDANGIIYFTEDDSGNVRRATPDGTVTTLVRDAYSTGGLAHLQGPAGIVVDPNGNLYIADSGHNRVAVATLISAPGITAQPTNIKVTAGWTAALSVTAIGNGISYQWRRNGIAVTGNTSATTSALTIDRTLPNDAGTYDCVLTNDKGTITSEPASLVVEPPSRLTNLSARAYGSTGNNVTIGGFVIRGGGSKRLLLRGVGPTLTKFGIDLAEVMADPMIEIHDALDNNVVVTTNDNWGDNLNRIDITLTAAELGASAIADGDVQSSAALLTLPPGVYSFIARDKADRSGVLLVEAYDADSATADSSLINISSRAYCGVDNKVTIAGFVVSGNAPKRLLLRAVGPSLAMFGLRPAELLHDPVIEIHDPHSGNNVVATNDNWGDNPNLSDIASATARVGAAALAQADATSSALLLTVQPGVYTAVARGKNGTAGIVLVEVYDAD